MPFTRWSLRKLAGYLAVNEDRPVTLSVERLRQILAERDITFQRTKTWKESNDPDRDAKLDRIEEVLEGRPERCFAFDEFGPLSVRPVGGAAWAPAGHPQRRPANYHKLHGVRQFHACYSIGDDALWGVVRRTKSAANTLGRAEIDPRRAPRRRSHLRHLGQPLGPQSPHRARLGGPQQRRVVLTPTYSSWANPIEAHFGPLREFVLNNSNHPNHTVLCRRLHAYLRWRNANARDPDLLAAQTPRTRPHPIRERPQMGTTNHTSA